MQCSRLPAVSGFLVSYKLASWLSTPPFNPDIHLAASDVQADSLVNPGSFRMNIKSPKTDPFSQGCYIYIGAGKCDLCLVCALPSIYTSVAQLLAHFSFSLMAPLYITNGWHPVFNLFSPLLGSLVATPVIKAAILRKHIISRRRNVIDSSDQGQLIVLWPFFSFRARLLKTFLPPYD